MPPPTAEWPSVGVVIATRNRPFLLRRALASVSEQDYPGPLRIVVVSDGAAPDWRLARGGGRPVLVLENWRTPGAAGARNTGILAAGDCDLVALCDDDDTWTTNKLTIQVAAMCTHPGAVFATCSTEIEYAGRRTAVPVGLREVGIDHLTNMRTQRPRASGFVARQVALATEPSRGGIGLIAEDVPRCGQEWDLLMRAARRGPIVHVDTALVRVLWRPLDIDPPGCVGQVRALAWMIARHPEIGGRASAAARVYAEMACWEAAAGKSRAAWAWARAALRQRWCEPSAIRAIAAAARLLRGNRLLAALRRVR